MKNSQNSIRTKKKCKFPDDSNCFDETSVNIQKSFDYVLTIQLGQLNKQKLLTLHKLSCIMNVRT